MSEAEPDDALERAQLILALRQRGIRDRAVMSALERVPRERFVAQALRPLAWADQALPTECGQTISQPAVVALMVQALDLAPSHRVLEVGTGTGYAAAILGQIVREVVTVERFRTLAEAAADRLDALGLSNVEVIIADGLRGHGARAPYDRVMLSAAVEEVPAAILEQMAPDGVLVAPIGPPQDTQMLVRMARTSTGIARRDLGAVRFVPMLPGIAAVL